MNLENPLLQISNSDLSLNGIRVLVVENDADTRLLYTILLESYGAEVFSVDSVKNALIAVEQRKPHLLISDIYLPGEDGYSLISKIRSLDPMQGGQIPAIAVTGMLRDLCENSSPAKFQLHFTKPIDLNDLVIAAAALAKPELMPQVSASPNSLGVEY